MAKSTKTQYYRALASYEKAVKQSSKEKAKEFKQKERSIKAETKLSKQRKDNASVSIKNFNKDYRSESVLSDPNRFFKQEMEEAKKSLFFS